MIRYNIENIGLHRDNKKEIILIKGWVFDDNQEIEIVINNNEIEYKLENHKRNDVYEYFKHNKNSLDSGFILHISNIEHKVKQIWIQFKNKDGQLLDQYEIDIRQIKKENTKEIINLENAKFVLKSLKKDGFKITLNKIKRKFKAIGLESNTEEYLIPYKFEEDSYIYKSINNKSIVCIINATNIKMDKKNLIDSIESIKKQDISRMIIILNSNVKYSLQDDILNEEHFELIYTDKELYEYRDVLKYMRTLEVNMGKDYILLINGGDSVINSTIARIQKEIDENEYKIITFNEDRIVENDYIAPFYKNDAIARGCDVDTICRRALVINLKYIEQYLNNKIDVKDIKVIDKVLYHYNLATTDKNRLIKPIAFYLPQFHSIPENDEWWGKGFTEWTNVRKGKSLFKHHYQPHTPGILGYYNLVEDKGIQHKQIELAKEYGIHGFCYYYYWFNGKRLLEKPLDRVLEDKSLDFPFCICWANETWSRRWDGQEKEVLIKQEHNQETDSKFIEDIIPILKDERYIKIGNAPLLLIYRAELFPNLKDTIIHWKEKCKEAGIDELHVSLVQSFGLTDPNIYGGDSAVEFPPHSIVSGEISQSLEGLDENFSGNIYDYRDVVARCTNKRPDYYKVFRGAMLSWDNTARRGVNANVFHYANPEEYKKWLAGIIDYTTHYNSKENQYIFINAWNEWAEGTHLEPDEKYGTQYLEVTKECLYSNY